MNNNSLIRVVINKIVTKQQTTTSTLPCHFEINHSEKGYFFIRGDAKFGFKIPRKGTAYEFSFWDPIEAVSFEKPSDEIMYDEFSIVAGKLKDNDPVIEQIKNQLNTLKSTSKAYPDCLQQLDITYHYDSMEKLASGDHTSIYFKTSTSFNEPLSIMIKDK